MNTNKFSGSYHVSFKLPRVVSYDGKLFSPSWTDDAEDIWDDIEPIYPEITNNPQFIKMYGGLLENSWSLISDGKHQTQFIELCRPLSEFDLTYSEAQDTLERVRDFLYGYHQHMYSPFVVNYVNEWSSIILTTLNIAEDIRVTLQPWLFVQVFNKMTRVVNFLAECCENHLSSIKTYFYFKNRGN